MPAATAPIVEATAEHRRRLLDAMASLVARQGYAATTIADIAAEARVSKRTFYEHFEAKSACLLALYEAASAQALRSMQSAIDPGLPWARQVEQAVQAYFSILACSPALVRTLILEILHLGAEGLRVRRRVNDAIARFIVEAACRRADAPAARLPLLGVMATAIVGGIDELLLQAVEDNRVERLPELGGTASHFVRIVIDGTLSTPRGP